jgi:hypothetical protein
MAPWLAVIEQKLHVGSFGRVFWLDGDELTGTGPRRHLPKLTVYPVA